MRRAPALEGTFDAGRVTLQARRISRMKRALGSNDFLLRIHGDEGPYFKGHNLMVISMASPFCHGVP